LSIRVHRRFGGPDASSASLESAATEAEKNCVLIDALRIFDLGQTGSDRGSLELAKVTGGKAHILDSSQIVPDLGRKVTQELHEYYTLLYSTSERIQPGAFRKVRVVARASPWRNFSVHTRAGYLTQRLTVLRYIID
jgi:hypothetical protein